MGLALCSRGTTLGKGTLRMYPSWSVPTILNTSLGRKYHPILEGDNVGDVGTWRLNHKGTNVNANKWLFCDKGEAVKNASVEERSSHLTNQRAKQKRL